MSTDNEVRDPAAEALAASREQEKKDLGIVDEAPAEEESKADESKDSKETDDTKESDKESDESKDEESKDESDESKNSDEKDEDEESDSDDEDDKDDDDDSDDDDSDDASKHVSPKDIKELKRSFKDQIKKLETELADARSPKEKKDAVADIKKLVQEKAAKLGVKPEVIEEIIDITTTAVKDKLSKVDELLADHDKRKDDKVWEQDQVAFNSEWNKNEPEMKKAFPNASNEQLAAAKKEMDALAHSRKYHRYDMDYILFKEKAKFDKILFSPKRKTFESSSPSANASDDLGDEDVDVSNLSDNPPTPAEFERIEKRRNAALAGAPQATMTLHTTDPKTGQRVERQV